MSVDPGTRLGPYEITAKIGAGGMGEVYRARDTKLGRDVAIKVLPEAFALDADRLARFTREAQVLASLNHPNIASIYGIEGNALVMELVEGRDLSEVLAGGAEAHALHITDALAIARQIADALDAAHEQGIVHRDLKPQNIKVREDGTVKVLDFGLAKAIDPIGSAESTPYDSPTMTSPAMTAMGMIIGTAAYMAPEQAKGKPVDKRADIWAFGVVFYEMLTGRRLFEAETVSEVLAAVLRADIDLEVLPASTPGPVRRLLARCLDRDTRTRLRDIGEARVALAGPVSDETPVASEPVWRRPTRWIVTAALMVMTALATWGVMRPTPGPPPPVGRFTFELPPPTDTANPFGNPSSRVLALSPDGSQMAFIWNYQVWVRRRGELDPVLLTPNESDARAPFFSPDGQEIGFASGGTIKAIALSGGTARDVGGPVPERPLGMSWAEDGFIYVGMEPGIARLPATGGPLETVVTVQDGERASTPQLLPGGEWLLFMLVGADQDWDAGRIVAEQLVPPRERKVLVERARDPRVASSGHLLFLRSQTLFAQAFDVGSVAVSGAPINVLEPVRTSAGNLTADAWYDVSVSGDLVYIEAEDVGEARLAWVDRQGSLTNLPHDAAPFTRIRLSPDGRRMVAQTMTIRDTEDDLWLLDVDRSGQTRLTEKGRRGNSAVWSPDGWIYYSAIGPSDLEGASRAHLGLWRRRDDLSGAAELVFADPEADLQPTSITRDGRRLSISIGGPAAGIQAALLDLDETAPPTPVSGVDRIIGMGPYQAGFELSPDGRFIVYSSAENGAPQVFVREIATGRLQLISTASARMPVWTRTGDEIIFSETSGRAILSVKMLSAEEMEFSTPVVVAQRQIPGASPFAVSPDAQRFLIPVPVDDTRFNRDWQIQVVLNWFEELRTRVPVK